MKLTKAAQAAREESRKALLESIKPGDTIHTVLRHVSKSGMSRRIDLYKLTADGPLFLTYHVARLCGYSLPDKGQGLRTDGCGMDMGFDAVYTLGRYLFPDGFGMPMRLAAEPDGVNGTRPSDPEEAALMVSKGWKARGRNGDSTGWDNDGGYALNHRWL